MALCRICSASVLLRASQILPKTLRNKDRIYNLKYFMREKHQDETKSLEYLDIFPYIFLYNINPIMKKTAITLCCQNIIFHNILLFYISVFFLSAVKYTLLVSVYASTFIYSYFLLLIKYQCYLYLLKYENTYLKTLL